MGNERWITVAAWHQFALLCCCFNWAFISSSWPLLTPSAISPKVDPDHRAALYEDNGTASAWPGRPDGRNPRLFGARPDQLKLTLRASAQGLSGLRRKEIIDS
jgi:hypothetical protein